MRKLLKMAATLVAALALTACGVYTVPPATKGKVLSTNGYSADVKEVGKYWLFGRDEMVLLDTSTQTYAEKMDVKMMDNLNLKFEVRFRTRISGDENTINSMFNDIKHQNYEVSLPMVYGVYGRDVVQSVARSVVGKYDTESVAANFDKITSDLQTQLAVRMKGSPLEVSNITLANLDYPETIDEAYKLQGAKKLAIETEASAQAVEMVKKQNELLLAEQDYAIQVQKAKTLRDQNRITADGLSQALIQYKALEVQSEMAKSDNTIFVPYESMGNSGLSNRMFQK